MHTLLLRALVILSLSPMAALHPSWVKGTTFEVGPRYASSCNAAGEFCSRWGGEDVGAPGDAMLVAKLILLGGLIAFLGAAFVGIAGHTEKFRKLRVRWIDGLQLVNAVTFIAMVYFVARTSTALGGEPTEIALGAMVAMVGIMGILQFAVRRWLRAEHASPR